MNAYVEYICRELEHKPHQPHAIIKYLNSQTKIHLETIAYRDQGKYVDHNGCHEGNHQGEKDGNCR